MLFHWFSKVPGPFGFSKTPGAAKPMRFLRFSIGSRLVEVHMAARLGNLCFSIGFKGFRPFRFVEVPLGLQNLKPMLPLGFP